jgi:hypothetical protein
MQTTANCPTTASTAATRVAAVLLRRLQGLGMRSGHTKYRVVRLLGQVTGKSELPHAVPVRSDSDHGLRTASR